MNVVVIDSATLVRARLVARLCEAGLDVVGEAATATVALDQVAVLSPDAIVLDVELVERSGFDLLCELRRVAPLAILVVFTNALPYRRWCLAHGADDFLDKSADFDAVAATLVRAASDHRAREKERTP